MNDFLEVFMSRDLLHVSIKTPESLVWEGDAESVSSKNARGPFDILPLHANFISLIDHEPIVIRSGGKKQVFTFPISVLYVYKNIVKIFVAS